MATPIRPLVVDRIPAKLVLTDSDRQYDLYGTNTWAGAYGLREMTISEYKVLKNWIRMIWNENKTVTLSVVASGGNLGGIDDTRLQAGAYLTRVDRFPTEAETSEPSVVPIAWDRINLTYDTSVAMPNYKAILGPTRPLRMGNNDAGNPQNPYPYTSYNRSQIYEYSQSQTNDLIMEALQEVSISDDPTIVAKAGGYAIYDDSTMIPYIPGTNEDGGNMTKLGRVFENTVANLSAYTAAGIPETRDQPAGVNATSRYDLWEQDNPTNIPRPLHLVYRESTGGIREYEYANMYAYFKQAAQHLAANGDPLRGNIKLNWYFWKNSTNINFGGTDTMGQLMVDYRYNGSGNYQTRYVNTNDYRAQEFPNGTQVVADSYGLRAYVG